MKRMAMPRLLSRSSQMMETYPGPQMSSKWPQGLQNMLYPALMTSNPALSWVWVHKNHSDKHGQLGGETDLQRQLERGNPDRHQSIHGSFDFDRCVRIQKQINQQFMGCRIWSPIFRATMPLQIFHRLSQVIRFDNRDTRPGCRQQDKLAVIREVWDKWVKCLPLIYNPSPNVTEHLVVFRGHCTSKNYMPSKLSKYGKFEDAETFIHAFIIICLL